MEASPRKRVHGAYGNRLSPGGGPSGMTELPITPVLVNEEKVVILSPTEEGITTPLRTGDGGRRQVTPFDSIHTSDNVENQIHGHNHHAKQLVRTKKLCRALGFFYHISFGVLFTTFTELLLSDFGNNFSQTAAFLGVCAGVERGVQFFSSPVLGNLSDSVGRRPILLLSLLLHFASLMVVAILPTRHSVLIYFLINGASNVTLGMINAIVADLCSAQGKTGEGELAQQYGRLGMAIGLSMILGPAIGPVLQKMNVLYPIYLSLAFLGVSIVIAWSMAESLQACHRALNINWRKANPFFVLREAMRFRRFQLFSGPFFLNQLTECVYQFVVLYTKRRFGWGYMTLGFYVSIIGICLAIIQGSLRYFVPRFVSENGCVTVGLFGHALAMGVISVATHGWMMGLTILPQMAASLKNPGLMSALAKGIAPEQQGVLQGSVSSLRVLSKAVGGPIFGAIVALSLRQAGEEKGPGVGSEWMLGLPFWVAAALDLLAAGICWYIFRSVDGLGPEGGEEGEGGPKKGGRAGRRGQAPSDVEAGAALWPPRIGREGTRGDMDDEESTQTGSGVSSLAAPGEEEGEGGDEGGREGKVVMFGTLECDGLPVLSPI